MHPNELAKCPGEVRRETKTVTCSECGKQVTGWTAYDKMNNIVDTGHYMEFSDGFVCDGCLGDDGSTLALTGKSPTAEDWVQRADYAATQGHGLTETEWLGYPSEYVGQCYKQCYANRVMEKGSVLEYGIRGVYVCSGCGYAYPPRCSPKPIAGIQHGEVLEWTG